PHHHPRPHRPHHHHRRHRRRQAGPPHRLRPARPGHRQPRHRPRTRGQSLQDVRHPALLPRHDGPRRRRRPRRHGHHRHRRPGRRTHPRRLRRARHRIRRHRLRQRRRRAPHPQTAHQPEVLTPRSPGETDHVTTEQTVVVALPESVRGELRRGVGSVLVDAAALRQVRERFDAGQAGALGRYLEASQSPNTLRAYRGDWIAWAAWCASEGRTALPADPLDIAVYLAAAADTRRPDGRWAFSPATLERRSAAIAAVHAANGLPSPTRSDVVRLTLRGIRRTRRTAPTRKRPVLLHTLEQLLDGLPEPGWPTEPARPPDTLALLIGFAGAPPRSEPAALRRTRRPAPTRTRPVLPHTPEHLLDGLPEPGWPTEPARRRDTPALLIGFAGALRRSELAGLRLGDIQVRTDHTTGEPVLLIHLPTTKTDPTGTAEHRVAVPRGRHPRTCPVCAYTDWLRLLENHHRAGTPAVRQHCESPRPDPAIHRCHGFTGLPADHDEHPLLPTISRHGHIGDRPMSGRAVAELVKRYAARAGLDPALFSGHSLRAGFATQAALGGAGDREIMRQGRWANPRTVHGYIRTADPLQDNAVTKLGL